jgi:N-6 DNA Methylase
MGPEAVARFRERMRDAVARNLPHDQRRQYLADLLRDGFGIDSEEVELEHRVKVDEIRGRIDLLYRRLLFEVKRDLDREDADVQAKLGLYLTRVGESGFALTTDGTRFDAYRLGERGVNFVGRLPISDVVSDETIFAWLDSFLFSQETVVPTAEDVVRRFGPDSPVYLALSDELRLLWDDVREEPSIAVKRQEWDALLRMVYGSEKGSDDLFVRHTYLALLARLFAYLALAGELPTAGEELEVISGQAFERRGINNLVEEDFFVWIAHGTTAGRAGDLLSRLARHLGLYATDQIDEDLLKQLYETLVDPVDRHDLGGYYTPDWLADLVLREAGYRSGMTVLDPACGSGTFLFSAIRLLREEGLSGAELVREAEARLAGFDVHPLAVTVSRANFVLALGRDAAEHEVTVPVWMADSLAVPLGTFGRPIEVRVPDDPEGNARRFVLPTEMKDIREGALREAVEATADLARSGVSDADAQRSLSATLADLGAGGFEDVWMGNLRLFRELVAHGEDSIWRFVLSNAVRPQVVARKPVEMVVGNPPWLPLRSISDPDYQDRVADLALHYGTWRVAPVGRRGRWSLPPCSLVSPLITISRQAGVWRSCCRAECCTEPSNTIASGAWPSARP